MIQQPQLDYEEKVRPSEAWREPVLRWTAGVLSAAAVIKAIDVWRANWILEFICLFTAWSGVPLAIRASGRRLPRFRLEWILGAMIFGWWSFIAMINGPQQRGDRFLIESWATACLLSIIGGYIDTTNAGDRV